MSANLKVLILIGIPASGKSTWSKDYIHKNPNTVRVGRDFYRTMLKAQSVCEPKIENLINDLLISAVHRALGKKLNVIIDNTNLKFKYIKQFIDEFKYTADIDYQIFDISLKKAIERDILRDATVGEAVIKKLYDDYRILMDTFDFQPVSKVRKKPVVVPDFKSDLQDAVIFDIDGTLTIMADRSPYDWDKVYKDDLNVIVAEQVEYHRSKGRKIIIVTGRDGAAKKQTEEWLALYGIEYDELFIKGVNDQRKDTIIKKEIYDNHIKGKYNVICIYDDRLAVLNTWYELGIFTFNVNQGNHSF